VSDGRTGFLVEPAQWGAFRQAVELLKENPQLRAAMSVAGRASVAEKTWEANNQRLLTFYEEAQRVAAGSAVRVAA
jgi:phosphatidylinositol alpha 1,6-mannosyltransferase